MRIPRPTSSALRIERDGTTAALQLETIEVVGHPSRANGRIDDYRRALPEARKAL